MARTRPNILAVAGFWIRDCTRYVRYAARRLTKPVSVKLHGVRLPIPPDASPKRLRSLLSERHERRAAYAIVAKIKPNDTVLELGGGLGFISTLCAKRIPSEQVYTFEANPMTVSYLEQVYEMNGVHPTLISGAIGTSNDDIEFWIHDQIVSSSTVQRTEQHRAVIVKQYDINQQIQKLKPTFLVVDVEGTEGELFRVADLSGIHKILIELHPKVLGKDDADSLVKSIESVGFKQNRWLSGTRKKFFER